MRRKLERQRNLMVIVQGMLRELRRIYGVTHVVFVEVATISLRRSDDLVGWERVFDMLSREHKKYFADVRIVPSTSSAMSMIEAYAFGIVCPSGFYLIFPDHSI